MLRITYLILGFALLCLSVVAQDPNSDTETFSDLLKEEAGDTSVVDEHDDIRQLVEKVLTMRLQRALELSDEQAVALGERIESYKSRLTQKKILRGAAREQLRESLDQGAAEKDVQQELEGLLSLEEEIAALLKEMIEEAGKGLSTPQSAKLYLFVGEFEAFMRHLIERTQYISRHGEPPPGSVSPGETESAQSGESIVRDALRQQSDAAPSKRESDMVALFDGLLMARLSQALDLGPEETVMLSRLMGNYGDQLNELKWMTAEARSDLRQGLTGGLSDEVIGNMLRNLLLQEETEAELIRMFVTEAQKNAGLDKSARLYLFVGDFEAYVTRLFEKAGQVSTAR